MRGKLIRSPGPKGLRPLLLYSGAIILIRSVAAPAAADAAVVLSNSSGDMVSPQPAQADRQEGSGASGTSTSQDEEQLISKPELEQAVPPLTYPAGQSSAPAQDLSGFSQQLTQPTGTTGPAPSEDPELRRPLPPLDEFDVRSVDVAQPAAESRQIELRYTVSVTGLAGAAAELGADLKGEFDNLSALKEGKGKAANEAMLRARLAQDTDLLQSILKSQGWYSGTVDAHIRRGSSSGNVVAVLSVSPGTRYDIGSVKVTGGATVPPDLVSNNLPVESGDPIVAANILAAEAKLSVALPEHGYPFATIGQRDILLDPETHLGDYTLPLDLGPRSRFGGFKTTGDLAFSADHVRTIARFKRGEIYDSRMVDDLRQALIATGLFNSVSVEPKPTGKVAPDGTEYVTMLVTQHAGPPRTIAGSAGYQTGQGFLVQGSWTHRNLFPPEGALIASATAGSGEQGASLTFRRSNAGKRDRTFQLIAEAARSTYDAFNAVTGRIATRLSYDSTPIWRKPLTWAVGAELIGSVEKAYDPSVGERRSRKYLIAGVNGELGIDRSDSLLNPTKGFKAKLLVQPEAALSDSLRPYVRGQIDASAYHPFGDSLVLAGRFRFGSTLGIDRFDLAPSRRFYAGGGGSVRGFGYQQLGPKDPDGHPLGGLSVVEGAAEVRYRFGDYGVVAFADTGQVYAQRIPTFRDLRVGVGVGVRYYTNFGPLRIDVATPLDRRPGESRFNVYVSIGQAF